MREVFSRFLRPGLWFRAAIVIGILIRLYLVLFTQGTYDVDIWQKHAQGVRDLGLIGYYHANDKMNHAPFIGVVLSFLIRTAEITGIPFRILLRAPFALLDGGTAILLLYTLGGNHFRFLITAGYWLHPLAMIFSAYHGNIDSAMAFFLVLTLYLLSKDKIIGAGAAIGLSLWVKLPAVLAIPAFLFAIQSWRKRFLFLMAIGVVGISTYIPALLKDPLIVYKNVFGYHGQGIQTAAGIPVWGTQIFLRAFFEGLSQQWQERLFAPIAFLVEKGLLISLLLIILLSWVRQSRRTVTEIGCTIAAVYTIVYGFSNYWSFQYLAWSLPFWFFSRLRFFIPATVITVGYIYSLYWFLCGNPWLLGQWNFWGKPDWPRIVTIFRDLAVAFFFVSGCVFLVTAIYQQIFHWRRPVKDNIL